jgi:hypothetical protein
MHTAQEVHLADRRTKVWLECTGEPFDFRSVDVYYIKHPVAELEVVTFFCPRCGQMHESLRYR